MGRWQLIWITCCRAGGSLLLLLSERRLQSRAEQGGNGDPSGSPRREQREEIQYVPPRWTPAWGCSGLSLTLPLSHCVAATILGLSLPSCKTYLPGHHDSSLLGPRSVKMPSSVHGPLVREWSTELVSQHFGLRVSKEQGR